jgi:hypothetical protein
MYYEALGAGAGNSIFLATSLDGRIWQKKDGPNQRESYDAFGRALIRVDSTGDNYGIGEPVVLGFLQEGFKLFYVDATVTGSDPPAGHCCGISLPNLSHFMERRAVVSHYPTLRLATLAPGGWAPPDHSPQDDVVVRGLCAADGDIKYHAPSRRFIALFAHPGPDPQDPARPVRHGVIGFQVSTRIDDASSFSAAKCLSMAALTGGNEYSSPWAPCLLGDKLGVINGDRSIIYVACGYAYVGDAANPDYARPGSTHAQDDVQIGALALSILS